MRTILHSDLNNFYASVECLRRPELKDRPVVVVGEKAERHGVVLAKNEVAKGFGVRTGDVYWQARQKCGKDLVEIEADFSLYLSYSRRVRKIYEEYSDRVEAYGIDECWLDETKFGVLGSGEEIAEAIRSRVKRETGLTVSVGVSFNKIFAKLASDMKKPDAVTVITKDNYQTLVWGLPVSDLLYVGRATERKLKLLGIYTIGDLAKTSEELLLSKLGKWGGYLYAFANGRDESPVMKLDEKQAVKSIGNSLTVYRDLTDEDDVFSLLMLLSDSVASRMREAGLNKGRGIQVFFRSSSLTGYSKQTKLPRPTGDPTLIARTALSLFRAVFPKGEPLRSAAVTVTDFCVGAEQLDMFSDVGEEKKERLLKAVDRIRKKYSGLAIRTAIVLKDEKLSEKDIKGEHVIHPNSFFRGIER